MHEPFILILKEQKGERFTLSWNSLWSQGHFAKRNRLANLIHGLVMASVREKHAQVEPFERAVHITITAIFRSSGRCVDADNLLDKPFIDGLVHAGVLKDDDLSWVSSATTGCIVNPNFRRKAAIVILADTQRIWSPEEVYAHAVYKCLL